MRKIRPTRGRVRQQGANGETEFVELEPGELSGIFAAPGWLRDLGVMAWLLVGVAGMLVAMVWLLSLTQTIVVPVVTAAILASVLAPLVRWLKHHRIPRGAGAGIVLLLIVVAGAALALLVLSGISAQSSEIESQLQSAANKIESTLKDLGVSSQTAATPRATRAARSAARSTSCSAGSARASRSWPRSRSSSPSPC